MRGRRAGREPLLGTDRISPAPKPADLAFASSLPLRAAIPDDLGDTQYSSVHIRVDRVRSAALFLKQEIV
jgi:hypothetical protein